MTNGGRPTTDAMARTDLGAASAPPTRWLRTAGWWAATLLTLVVLDDLTFGPVFWLVSRLESPLAGFALALLIYIPAQIALVRAGTSDAPGRLATFFLSRLDLERRSTNVAEREQRMRARVTGVISASLLSTVIGGVLPPLGLWRAGYGRRFVRRLSWLTATIYALEFSLLHGYLPGML